MTGTDWQDYPSLSSPAADDTLLILDTSDTSASSAGTVKQVTAGAAAALSVDWVNVAALGADPTGSAACDTVVNDAITALGPQGGVIYFPSGTYKVTSGITALLAGTQTVTIRGDGASATILSYHGSGDCIRMYNDSAFGSGGAESWFSGIRDLTVDGTSGTGSPAGIHAGDITFLQVRGVVIQNFTGTGSIGLHLDNTVNWTEEGDYRLGVSNCTRGVVLEVTTGYNSFGYSNFDVTFFQTGPQSCFCVTNGSLLYHSTLRMRGDVNGSASALTGNPAVIVASGAGPGGSQASGDSPGISGTFDVQIESNDQSGAAPHLMQTLYLDASTFGYIAGSYGIMDFAQGTGSFAPADSAILPGATGNLISFSGVIAGDSVLNPTGLLTWQTWGGGTLLNALPSAAYDGYFPTIQADVFETTLDGGESVVYLNYGGAGDGDTLAGPQRKLLFIHQPSSGGPYALTWPSNGSPTNASPTVTWPGGAPPVLQTAASAVDVIELLTYDGATWYGRQLTPAGVPAAEQFTALTTTYTLTSTTSTQKLFNATANGALTVAASTSYFFECSFSLSSMSSTSGNCKFDLVGAGTATLTSVAWTAVGLDNSAVTTAAAVGGSFTASSASSGNIVTAATGTGMFAQVKGIVRVNAGGTIIPSVGLTTAAAAVVGANSWFRIWPAGSSTVTSAGNWS